MEAWIHWIYKNSTIHFLPLHKHLPFFLLASSFSMTCTTNYDFLHFMSNLIVCRGTGWNERAPNTHSWKEDQQERRVKANSEVLKKVGL
jgi:hypothetical protein